MTPETEKLRQDLINYQRDMAELEKLRHYFDEAGGERNLLALLDLYHSREREAQSHLLELAHQATGLLDVTGEYDEDGDWQACPQSSLTATDRDEIKIWVKGWWVDLYNKLEALDLRIGAGGEKKHGE